MQDLRENAGRLIDAGAAESEKRMMPGETICLWCAAQFTLRRGGSPKKFCSTRCRREFHSCARRWAEAAVAARVLSVDVLKNGDPAACTLLPRANSPAATQSSALIGLRADSPYARQCDFERLLARTIAARRR
jgi:hypothetical protein